MQMKGISRELVHRKYEQYFNKSRINNTSKSLLDGGFNPSEKYQSVRIIIPYICKIENVPNHQPDSEFPSCGYGWPLTR